MTANEQKITFAGGCFWCTEAIFGSLRGVTRIESGYMGGNTANPTYMEICNGKTGHAEVIDIAFDANTISLDELLLVFFKTHNPTMFNRQGGDTGTQYRSAIFYNMQEQRLQAEAMIKRLTAEQVFERQIVTQVYPAGEFYKAEDYHQHYYHKNPLKPYCAVVIQPKLNKFMKEFTDIIKPELL